MEITLSITPSETMSASTLLAIAAKAAAQNISPEQFIGNAVRAALGAKPRRKKALALN